MTTVGAVQMGLVVVVVGFVTTVGAVQMGLVVVVVGFVTTVGAVQMGLVVVCDYCWGCANGVGGGGDGVLWKCWLSTCQVLVSCY